MPTVLDRLSDARTRASFTRIVEPERLAITTSAFEDEEGNPSFVSPSTWDNLNAIITMDAERASERAREADEALARRELWGPLHGVPFTLKDAHVTAGMRTTTGFPPPFDGGPVH